MHLSVAACLTGILSLTSALPSPLDGRNTACSPSGISSSRAAQVVSAFSKAKLVPQVVPAFTPKVEVSVVYGSKAANLGNTFAVSETTSEPTIKFSGETDHDPATTKYSILFIDPDAPGPTADGKPASLSPFLHRAVYDASPSCINPANDGGGKSLAMYKPLTPLSAAQHRYTQLVYRQPAGFKPPADLAYTAGANFNLAAYTKTLTLVGGNYFLEGLTNVA